MATTFVIARSVVLSRPTRHLLRSYNSGVPKRPDSASSSALAPEELKRRIRVRVARRSWTRIRITRAATRSSIPVIDVASSGSTRASLRFLGNIRAEVERFKPRHLARIHPHPRRSPRRRFRSSASQFGFPDSHSTNSTATGVGMMCALCASSSNRRTAARPCGP